jgi:hypothetical protein
MLPRPVLADEEIIRQNGNGEKLTRLQYKQLEGTKVASSL